MIHPKPSATDAGVRWLKNFDLADREAAKEALDAIRFVGGIEFRDCLDRLVQQAAASLGPAHVATLVLGDARSETFMGPADLRRSGSDGTVLEIVERAARLAGAHSELDVTGMRAHRIHHLLLVTDNIGSGDQVLSLVDFIRTNRTVRSWLSNDWLDFHVITYSVTAGGLRRLSSHERIASVHYAEPARDLRSDYWTTEKRERFVAVCRKYAHRKANALGRKGALAMIAFAHSVPNNLPAIVVQSSERRGWIAFARGPRWAGLDRRSLRALDSYRPAMSFTEMAARLRQPRLESLSASEIAALERSGYAEHTARLILVLAAHLRGISDPFRLCDLLSCTFLDLSGDIADAKKRGLLTPGGAVTGEGRAFLRAAKRKVRAISRLATKSDESFYYPQSLRRGDSPA